MMADASKYACSGFVNGHICTNGIRVRREVLENRLLAAIKSELLTDASMEELQRRMVKALSRPDPNLKRRNKLLSEIERLTDAIAQGLMWLMSPAVALRLRAAEAELAALPAHGVVDLQAALEAVPQALERYRALVADLGTALLRDVETAREAIREVVGRSEWSRKTGTWFTRWALRKHPSLLSQEGRRR